METSNGMGMFLANLPQRGTMTECSGPVLMQAPLHICDYDTSPPPDQVINTDPTNILIRALTTRKGGARDDPHNKGSGSGPSTAKNPGAATARDAKDPKGKRPISEVSAGGDSLEQRPTKRGVGMHRDGEGGGSGSSSLSRPGAANAGAGVASSSRPHAAGAGAGAHPRVSKAELESYTVERLRAILKEFGLSVKGRKEELLARAKRQLGYK